MFRLLIDENFDHRILRGLELRFPHLDYSVAVQVGLRGSADADILNWAATHNRIILTHDAKTMTQHCARLREGLPMAGLIIYLRACLSVRRLEISN